MARQAEMFSEEELVQRAKKGDRLAFGHLVERYQDQVYTLSCRTLGDPSRAEDVAQEAFIRAWKAMASFRGQSKFSSWLYRITLNSCFSELRRRARPVDQLPQDELESLNVTGNSAEPFVSAIEKRDLVEKLIQGLPPLYRSMVVLFYLQELDCQEIATILERPVGTVKAYLHRARAQLRTGAEKLLQTGSPSK